MLLLLICKWLKTCGDNDDNVRVSIPLHKLCGVTVPILLLLYNHKSMMAKHLGRHLLYFLKSLSVVDL